MGSCSTYMFEKAVFDIGGGTESEECEEQGRSDNLHCTECGDEVEEYEKKSKNWSASPYYKVEYVRKPCGHLGDRFEYIEYND